MRVADFSFDLPDELIARFPKEDRTSSRLLTLDGPTGALEHKVFSDILELVNENDLLVFNNTKVIPARMYGQKESGGKVEVLVERVLDEHRVLAHVRASKSPKEGSVITLEGKAKATMVGRHAELFEWCISDGSCMAFPRYLGADGVELFTQRLVEEAGVLLLPGSIYASSLTATPTDRFRIGFGRTGVDEGLAAMDDYLSSSST